MKKVFSIILAIAFVASGCSNNQLATNVPSESPTAATPTEITVISSHTATVTQTSLPTVTSTPAITPTFDPATVITRTPSIAAQCPDTVDDLQQPIFPKPEFPVSFYDHIQLALDFLNQGGKPDALINAMKNSRWLYDKNMYALKDITGDGIDEIIVSPSETLVFGCKNNEYQILLTVYNEGYLLGPVINKIVAIEDMNLDGIPELAVASYGCGGMGQGMCLDGWVYEWNRDQFTAIAEVSLIGRQTSGDQPLMEVKNINNDNLLELTLTGGIISGGDFYYFYPWRQQTDTYAWNGEKFVFQSTVFSKPQFRYQVIQDADHAVIKSNYDEAIKMYQNAIYGNYDWFSMERKQYIKDTYDGIQYPIEPNPDPKEQPNIAGYAFFRIVVTYVLEGNLSEAETAYDRIRKNFSEGSPGYDYVIIANEFWNEYQTSQDLGKACKTAINYAIKNPDILKYLGSDYHNAFQDIMYGPTDICPFKN